MSRITIAAVAWVGLATAARADVRTRRVEYRQGDTVLEGFLAWDDAVQGRRPGVLVIHEWWGQNPHARDRAVRLAREGYVGFALDMYGKGKVATEPAQAMAYVREATKDAAILRARFDAARELLQAQPQVDPKRIGVVGFCFGGGVALQMARVGEPVDAVATFHASIPAPVPVTKGTVKPRILVATGGSDPLVPLDRVHAFDESMKAAGARIEVTVYPEAKHGFTNPEASRAGGDANAYDAKADRESWTAALKLFHEVFSSPAP